jgi:hypothetical protein
VRQQFPQDGAGAEVKRHFEPEVELVLGVIGALAGERETLELRSSGIHLDLSEGFILGAIHDDLRGADNKATAYLRERYASLERCQGAAAAVAFQGGLHFDLGGATAAVGRRGVKEYRAPEALALIAADRQHVPLVCPSCATRSIVRVPRRRGRVVKGDKDAALVAERVTLTCQTCGRHASYIQRGPEAPRDDTMDPHSLRV